jgi:dihydrofolate reductase
MNSISVIAAVSLNGIIGDSKLNTMPWYLPSDLNYFKKVTFGEVVVMGVNTYDSIGKPLKSRRNVVITRNKETAQRVLSEGVDETYSSISEATRNESRGFFVIGGQMMYEEALRLNASTLYVTVVNATVEGDVRFPINGKRFLDDKVVLQNGQIYVKDLETEWYTENGLEFKHTVFKIKQ